VPRGCLESDSLAFPAGQDPMSSGGLPSSRRPDSDESQQHAGYICMGCRHTWSSLFALRQHQGSPYMRGTSCGSLHSAAELRNVQRSNLGTGFAQAVPIFRPGTPGRSLSRPFGDQIDSYLCIFAYYVKFFTLCHIIACYGLLETSPKTGHQTVSDDLFSFLGL